MWVEHAMPVGQWPLGDHVCHVAAAVGSCLVVDWSLLVNCRGIRLGTAVLWCSLAHGAYVPIWLVFCWTFGLVYLKGVVRMLSPHISSAGAGSSCCCCC